MVIAIQKALEETSKDTINAHISTMPHRIRVFIFAKGIKYDAFFSM